MIGGLPKKCVLLTNFSLLKHSPGAAPGIGELRWKAEEALEKLIALAVSKSFSIGLGSGFFWKENLALLAAHRSS